MDIEINYPINIAMDVIELDEHIPSMKFDIIIRVNKVNYSAVVNSQLWIECEYFNKFIDNMRSGEIAHLKGMSDAFELRLNSSQGWLEWSCIKEELDECITSMKGNEKLNDESQRALYQAFNDYPKIVVAQT